MYAVALLQQTLPCIGVAVAHINRAQQQIALRNFMLHLRLQRDIASHPCGSGTYCPKDEAILYPAFPQCGNHGRSVWLWLRLTLIAFFSVFSVILNGLLCRHTTNSATALRRICSSAGRREPAGSRCIKSTFFFIFRKACCDHIAVFDGVPKWRRLSFKALHRTVAAFTGEKRHTPFFPFSSCGNTTKLWHQAVALYILCQLNNIPSGVSARRKIFVKSAFYANIVQCNIP